MMPISGRPDFDQACWIGELDGTVAAGTDLLLDGAEGYRRARFLVREHRRVRGFVETPVEHGRVRAEAIRAAVAALPALPVVTAQATGSRPSFTVVICTRDRADQLRVALRSVLDLDYPGFEVVVVDNASRTDATRRVVAEVAAARPDVALRMVSEPRPGLSRARNAGLAAAAHDLVAFTDDDVVVDRHWLSGLADGFADRSAGRVACVTGIVPSGELRGRSQLYFEQRVWWSHSLTPVVVSTAHPPQDEPLFPFRVGLYGTGANFAVRREAVRAVGGFDEGLGVGSPTGGGEDIDMFVRLIDAGHALAYRPDAVIWHRHRLDDDALMVQARDYGVGLGAWLTTVALDPRLGRQASRRALGATVHLFRTTRGSAPTSDLLPARYAASVRWAERLSVLRGPLRLRQARRQGALRRPLLAPTGDL